ncbi:MAG TPA: hypothetical protein PK967_12720 [Candidatus Hydrogenedentes bacterium]|nr:hypothetical protein [Candidatus Hydrogenedentota bacterium]
MSHLSIPATKCGTEACPLVPVLDAMRAECEAMALANRALRDNVGRLIDMVELRGCPPDVCVIARTGKE